jgi:RND family efflux transporter MFP subunit
MSKFFRRVLLLSVVGAIGAGGYAIWSGALPLHKRSADSEIKQARTQMLALAPSVTVVRAAPSDLVETVILAGTVVAREEILVGPEVEGLRIVDVLADEGDQVKKGQVLVRLVSDTLEAQLAQNAAAIARAKAAIAQARSNITSAEARVVEARNALERGKPLRQSGYMSDAVLDQREAAARTANAALAAANDALNVAEAEKAQAEAQRRDLEWRRSRTEIAAPADGLVSRRLARVGGFAAGAGDALFRIVARGEVEVEGEVPEGRLMRMKDGQQASVLLVDGSSVPGTVRVVSPEVDRQSRLGRVRVFLGVVPGAKVGSFARVTIETARSRGLAVPTAAVQFAESGTSVLVVSDRTVSARRVRVGVTAGARTEIVDGLKDGELVVARSGTFLRDGDVVNPVVETTQLSEAAR